MTPASVIVTVDHDLTTNVDDIRVNGYAISDRDIAERLKTLSVGSHRDVIIEAPADSRYAAVENVIDAALAGGYSRIGLANRVIGTVHVTGIAGFEFTPYIRNDRITRAVDEFRVIVEMSDGVRITIDGKNATGQDLYQAVRRTVIYHREHRKDFFVDEVSVIASSDTRLGSVIRVLDAAQRAGDDNVSLILPGPTLPTILNEDPATSTATR